MFLVPFKCAQRAKLLECIQTRRQQVKRQLNVIVQTAVPQVKRQPDGKLTINILDDDGSHLEIKDNDHVFFATGRVPNTKNLGLEAAGVKLGE